jgi:TM2 domain
MDGVKQLFLTTSLDRWQVQGLSYTYYLLFVIFLGFFGLDYWYLGAPGIGLLKFLMNSSTFGYWWFYDALNAVFNQDQVRLFGPSVPGVGSVGIGAARFRDDKRPKGDKELLDKHMNYMLYGLILVAFGLFGGDSLLTGDTWSFIIRLVCIFTIILAPIAIVWWAMNLYTYFGNSDSCINQHWEFFGAPEPDDADEACPNPLMLLTVWLLETTLTILEFVPFAAPIATFVRAFVEKLKVAYGMVKVGIAAAATEIRAARRGAAKLKSGLMQGLPTREELEALKQDPLPSEEECGKKPSTKVDLNPLSGTGKEVRERLRGAPEEGPAESAEQVAKEEAEIAAKISKGIGLDAAKAAAMGLQAKMPTMEGLKGKLAGMKADAALGKLPTLGGLKDAAAAPGPQTSQGSVEGMLTKGVDGLKKLGLSDKTILKGAAAASTLMQKGIDKVKAYDKEQAVKDAGKPGWFEKGAVGLAGMQGKIDATKKKYGLTGGGGEQEPDSPILPFLLIGTIGIIIVSSIVLSLRRSMQNAAATKASKKGADERGGEEDDVPPEPRGPRVVATNA